MRNIFNHERGAERAEAHKDAMVTDFSLHDAIRKFLKVEPNQAIAFPSNKKVNYVSVVNGQSSRYEIVEDVRGGYFRISDKSLPKDENGYPRYVDRNGVPFYNINSVTSALSHFHSYTQLPSPILNDYELNQVRRFLALRDGSRPATITTGQKRILQKALPFLSDGKDSSFILSYAERGDLTWKEPIEKLLTNWSTIIGRTTWREYNAVVTSKLRNYILARTGRNKIDDLVNHLKTRDDQLNALKQINGEDLNENELDSLLVLARNAFFIPTYRAFIQIAEASGDPRWIVIFDYWTSQLIHYNHLNEYSTVVREINLSRQAMLRSLARSLHLSDRTAPTIKGVRQVIELAELTKDKSLLPILTYLKSVPMIRYTDSANQNESLLPWGEFDGGPALRVRLNAIVAQLS